MPISTWRGMCPKPFATRKPEGSIAVRLLQACFFLGWERIKLELLEHSGDSRRFAHGTFDFQANLRLPRLHILLIVDVD